MWRHVHPGQGDVDLVILQLANNGGEFHVLHLELNPEAVSDLLGNHDVVTDVFLLPVLHDREFKRGVVGGGPHRQDLLVLDLLQAIVALLPTPGEPNHHQEY